MKQIKQFLLLATLFVSGVMWGGTNVCTVYDNNGTELISYENLGDAFNFAVNNPNLTMHIVMTADYTLPAGDYTLPANASLLIPHKADQKKPYGEDPWRIKVKETETAFRTLTFADGVNIVVKGMLEISSQQYVGSADKYGTGRVAGAYGQLTVADGCNVWLDNGSKLCAWGYMFGNGNVQAKRGATVYEMFQVYDWKGGTNVTTHFLDYHHGVFPFNQYFIQNIEMPVTYQPGSQLLTSFGITANGEIIAVNNIGIIGTRGNVIKSLFEMDDADAAAAGVWVRKSYNPTADRQVYEINNAAYLNAMSITALGWTFSSDAYQLPITNNMDIHLLAGFMDITQDVTMLPGSQIEVDKESIVRLLPNKNVYLYDLDQWADYAYPNLYACKVWDSPSWATRNQCPRDVNKNGKIDKEDELTDASINIHGTLELHGNIFTTTDNAKTDGGANIFSTNADAGTIQFADDYTTPADSAVYQWKQTKFPDAEWPKAMAPSAWLLNGDNSFVKTGDLATLVGKSLCYINDAWTSMTTIDCFVKDEVNNKWYIKPAEYVQIFVEGAEPEENDEHLYTDVDKTRLFLLEEANCQWWEVTYQSDKDAYYCAANNRYYRYNEDDEEWQEAKVIVTFDPANGQSSVNYNVKLGAIPQYVGDDPVKEQDQTGSYTFQGWSSDGGTTIYKFNPMPEAWSDITYTAQYNKITRLYLITFANAKDGANVGMEFEYNTPAATVAAAITPTKADDDIATNYQFIGWDKPIADVTEAATYTAIFDNGTPNAYTITWLNENGSLIKTDENVPTTSHLNPPTDPEPSEPGTTFAGWRNQTTKVIATSADLRNEYVTGDATYQAEFTKTGSYRIVFKNEAGHVYQTQYVDKGKEYFCPTLSGTDIPANHQFIGWSPAIYTRAIATEDVTYTAHFCDISGVMNVASVTIEDDITEYDNFENALRAVCAASGNVTLKMLKNVEYAHNFFSKLQNNTNLTWDLNGCEVKFTKVGYTVLTMQDNDTVIVCDSSIPQGGRILNTVNPGSNKVIASASGKVDDQIVMKGGAVIWNGNGGTSPICFELYGDGSSFIMDGGYVELNGSTTNPILKINKANQSVEFNGGKWYFKNMNTSTSSITTAIQTNNASTVNNIHFTMNGGEIEVEGDNNTSIYSGATASSTYGGARFDINKGRLSVHSTNGDATIFALATKADHSSSIYIIDGEFDAKTDASAKVARIVSYPFTGQIIGGKYKVSAPTPENKYYYYEIPSTGLKGGFYNIFDAKLSNGLSGGVVLQKLKESAPEYAEGYRYQATQSGLEIQWKSGFMILCRTGAAAGEKIVPYPGGEEFTWYTDEECTQPWNFATDIMPDHALMLYAQLTNQEVKVSMDGEKDAYCSFAEVWGSSFITKPCTITLQKDFEYAASDKSIIHDVTLDLNGYTLTQTTTSSANKFAVVQSDATLTIDDKSDAKNGQIIANSATEFIEVQGTIVMNGGTITTPSTSTIQRLCAARGTSPVIEFNGGAWNIQSAYTSAVRAIVPYVATTLNMNGGTIEVENTSTSKTVYAQVVGYPSSAQDLYLNMTGGRLISISNGNNAASTSAFASCIFSAATSSVINISGGELIVQTKALNTSNNRTYIAANSFTGNITGGKFKVEKIGASSYSATIAFCRDALSNKPVKGGYFNENSKPADANLATGCSLIPIAEGPLYAEGYRYYVYNSAPTDLTITDNTELPANTTVSGIVTIKKNGRLTVPADITLTTNDFIIEATTTESGELINAGTVTVNGNAYFDLTFNAQAWTGSEWYSFAVPFEVDATSGISYGGAPLGLGTNIDILYYDGATRAANGANGSAWKYVENLGNKTLFPGTLYLAAFREAKPNAVRFTKKSGADLIFSGTTLNLNSYSAAQTTDAGWNAIANPTLHHATLTADDITNGQVYVNGEDRYDVVTLASDELVVGRPIMIQTEANKSVVINTPAASAPVRKLMTNTSSNYSVVLSQDGKLTDRVIVAIDDYAIDEYTIGQDLAKAGVSTKVAQMWVDRYDAQLCKNTVAADNNMAEYPLTISAPKAGEYTIALEQIPTDGVLFLTENGSITWNLNIAPATLDLSKGTDTTYGLRLVRKAGDVVTGNNEVILNGDVQKVIINDRLYIIRDGKVYSAHGHVIK